MLKYYKIISYILIALVSGATPSPRKLATAVAIAQPGAAQPLRVSPGRVVFEQSRDGRWLRFGRRDQPPLLTGGSIAVLAGKTGDPVRVVATAENMRRDDDQPRWAVVGQGERERMRRRDDDRDGLIDEDRLDGIDNDGDGAVDEDFAAIGDEMIVARYSLKSDDAEVAVHQETYAWALAHIDGMVATAITVENHGETHLANVRVAVLLQTRENLAPSTDVRRPTEDNRDGLSGITLTWRGGGESMSAMFFTRRRPWTAGNLSEGDALSATVAEMVGEERRDSTAPLITRGQQQSAGSPLALSPNLGDLAPGETVTIYAALVAVDRGERTERAIEYARRTVVGDGTNRLIPPPIAMTRRTVNGTYALRVPGDPGSGVAITLHDVRDQGVNPQDIKYVTGIDWREATRNETPNGGLMVEVSGPAPKEFVRGGKFELRGRLRNGEVFDLAMRPARGNGMQLTADQYWGQRGKLDEALLSGSPNPFRESTMILYEIPSVISDENAAGLTFSGTVDASVKVYDVTGKLVSTLVDDQHGPGQYRVQWSAIDDTGGAVASGVYYVKLQIGKRYITKRLLQLK